MSLLRRLSIQKKLLFSMGLCLLLFMAISSFLSVRMSSDYVRERVVSQEDLDKLMDAKSYGEFLETEEGH